MGTPFTPGQLNKLQTSINIAVTTALPNVVQDLDPKITLRALDNRVAIFAGHMEVALKEALNKMFMLGNSGSVAVKVAERHDPDTFYRTRSGLYVYEGFRNLVVAKAKPTEAGTIFTLDHALLMQNMSDEKIEASLSKQHVFDKTSLCAIIATMIAEQPEGREGKLLNNGYANLFYTTSCVVLVAWRAVRRRWGVGAWERDDFGWRAGSQVFSPATAT